MRSTNLFELFATITLDDSEYNRGIKSAKNSFGDFASWTVAKGQLIADGIKQAGKIAVDVGKQVLGSYAEYEQLVGGLKLSLGDSYDFMAEKAKSAYETMGLSTNEYMNQVSIYATGLVNALATTTEQAEGAITEATIEGLEERYDAMEKANDKKVDMLEEANEKEIEDFEKLTNEKIKLIDKQYTENLKLIDEEEYKRLQAIQNEIDAINAQQAADDKAAKQREENAKKAALQEEIRNAETVEERQKAQQELNNYLAKLEAERVEESRKARITELKNEKDAVKSEADEKRAALKEQRDQEVQLVKDSAAEQLKEIKKSQKAELEALKDSNKQKLEEMRDYIAEQKKLVTDGTVQVTQITEEARRQAAVLADDILTAQADIVAATGQSQDAVQNAFSGLMRSEYTLLDNLRLGITPTKEGFQDLIDTVNEWNAAEGNATNYVIDNLADAQNALVDYIAMQEMSGYAAAEAGTTISGALASAGAAWNNLVTGMADKNADISQLINNFVTTITGDGSDTNLGVFGTLIPTVEKALNGVGELISKLLPVAMDKIPDIIKTTLPTLITAAGSIVTAIGQGILENATLIVTYAQQVITDFVKSILENLPEIVQAGVDIIVTLTNGATEMWKELFPALIDAILEIADVLTNSENLDKMIDAAIDLAIAISDGLMNGLPKILDKAPEIVEKIAAKLIERGPDIVDAGIKIIGRLFEDMPQILMTLGEGVQEMIDGIVDKFLNHDWAATGKQIVGSIKDAATKAWSNWEDFGANVQEMGANSTIFGYIGNKIAGVETEPGTSRGGQREPSIVQNNYFTAPYDANEQDKANQKALNGIAYGY